MHARSRGSVEFGDGELLEIGDQRHHGEPDAQVAGDVQRAGQLGTGGNCIKIGLPGKSILRYYFQENGTSRRPFLLLRIRFPGRPIFIQFIPGNLCGVEAEVPGRLERGNAALHVAREDEDVPHFGDLHGGRTKILRITRSASSYNKISLHHLSLHW